MVIKVDAIGDTCPIPVVKTKNAIKDLKGSGIVETLVDNEIAVQNLLKMAEQKGYRADSKKLEEGKYLVVSVIGDMDIEAELKKDTAATTETGKKKNIVVAIGSDQLGTGPDPDAGRALMKNFIFSLDEQETLPTTMLFYNSGAFVTTEGSPSLECLKAMEERGVEILTCGACMMMYHLEGKLKVGSATNMYVVAEKMMNADLVVRP